MATDVTEKFMVYGVEWEEDGNGIYAVETMIHLARLAAWTGCVVMTMITEVRRDE